MGQVLFAPALAGCTSDDVTASAAQVLSGYTALTKDSNDDPISGTMTNRGAWTSSSSGSGRITVPAGYHNGSGYVDCSGAYNAGVTAADARANSSSTNYKSGYNSGYSAGRSQGQADVKANPGSYGLESGGSYQNGYNAGVTAADARANTSSANYKAGYNAGYEAGNGAYNSITLLHQETKQGGVDPAPTTLNTNRYYKWIILVGWFNSTPSGFSTLYSSTNTGAFYRRDVSSGSSITFTIHAGGTETCIGIY